MQISCLFCASQAGSGIKQAHVTGISPVFADIAAAKLPAPLLKMYSSTGVYQIIIGIKSFKTLWL